MSQVTHVRRRPGRPRKTDGEHALVRARILAATERALGGRRCRDVTVTRIIEEAGITRTGFYRYYRNAEEPLRIMLEGVFASLLADLGAVSAPAGGAGARIEAGLDVYLGWCDRNRHLLVSRMTDGHDPATPLHDLRRQVLDDVVELLGAEFTAAGRPRPERSTLDVLANSIEYTCHRLFLDDAPEETARAQARSLVLRMAEALLGPSAAVRG